MLHAMCRQSVLARWKYVGDFGRIVGSAESEIMVMSRVFRHDTVASAL